MPAVLRQKFGYFFFEKRVKFPAFSFALPKTIERTQPRPKCFSVTVPFLAKPVLQTSRYRISQTPSKFGQRSLVKKNEPGKLSQSETESYFE